jgi:hypothetical protein
VAAAVLKRRAIVWTVLGTVFVQLEALPWRRARSPSQNIVARR